jgi:hypothetical protein
MELHRTDEGFALYKEKHRSASARSRPPQRGLPSPRLASNRSGGAKATAPIY